MFSQNIYQTKTRECLKRFSPPVNTLTANWKVILNCQKGKIFAWATSSAWRKEDFARWNWPWKLQKTNEFKFNIKNKLNLAHCYSTFAKTENFQTVKTTCSQMKHRFQHFQIQSIKCLDVQNNVISTCWWWCLCDIMLLFFRFYF